MIFFSADKLPIKNERMTTTMKRGKKRKGKRDV
jgi:hypothetical protein